MRGLGLVVVCAAFAFALARLRRVPRPRFEPVTQYASGRVVLGRVWLSRRGETGSLLGWSVLCDGREVLARPGAHPMELTPLEGDRFAVRVRASDGRVREAVLDAARCAVQGRGA